MSSGDNQTTNQNKDEPRNQTQEESKKRRRQKNNDAERDFVCNCGKSYLSYPALYTHVKNKHGPEMMSSMVKKARGGGQLSKYIFQPLSQPEKQQQTTTILMDLTTFFKQLSDVEEPYDIKELFETMGQNNQILKCCQSWITRAISDSNKVHPETGLYLNITIDQIFGKFISRFVNKICKTVLVELITVFTAWRNNLNKFYAKFDSSGVVYGVYCQQASASLILDSVNDLVYTYLDEAVASYCLPTQIFLHRKRREYNLCRLIFLFAKWLYADRYTNQLLKFNSPDS